MSDPRDLHPRDVTPGDPRAGGPHGSGTDRHTAAESLEASGSDAEAAADDEIDDAPRNPFDNPYFLPVLLLGLSVWFGYDGWLNSDEHMQQYRLFNQIGFGLLVLGGLWTLVRARRETRAKAQSGDRPAG